MAAWSGSDPFEVEGLLRAGTLDGRNVARDQTHRREIERQRDQARAIAAIADCQNLLTRLVVPRARDFLDRLA